MQTAEIKIDVQVLIYLSFQIINVVLLVLVALFSDRHRPLL